MRNNEVKKQLNSSEAVYGFAAWLTTRKEKTVMSATDDTAPIAKLVDEFCKVNNLPEVSENWPNNLIHPGGKLLCRPMEKDEIMNVNAIVQQFLVDAGYDGLVDISGDCGCLVTDFVLCGEIQGSCKAAYNHGDKNNFCMREEPKK